MSMPPTAEDAPAAFDICGIGNALMDVVAAVDEGFITKHDCARGTMTLIDTARAESLYAAMPQGQLSGGGSGANTAAVAASLGARVAYLGQVADDRLGQIFASDMAQVGVHFPTVPLSGGDPTGRCLVLVTPDGQRTMNTYLGASVTFGPAQVDAAVVAASRVLYLEGFLFDPPAAQAAFHAAAHIAHAAGRQVALSLSDPWCVDRHRAAFRSLVAGHVDILFANEAEIASLYEEERFEVAAERARADVRLAALTRSEAGSVVLSGQETVEIAAEPAEVVDTTGAGDAYAAGFLVALTAGHTLAMCGRLGSVAAAEVIGHYGARPQRDLGRELDRLAA
jgi:sugar/nucleoside kinase (ribokinase family)